MTWMVPIANANPAGGVVVHGNVDIGAGAGGNLQITQTSQRRDCELGQFFLFPQGN